MRNKWGLVSTRGTLPLSSDLMQLPPKLAKYVVVHELLHLQIPDYNDAYRLLLARYIPDWREREQVLGRWGDVVRGMQVQASEGVPLSYRQAWSHPARTGIGTSCWRRPGS